MDFGTEEEMFKMTDDLLYLSKLCRQVGSAIDNSNSISTSTGPNETWSLQAVFILYM